MNVLGELRSYFHQAEQLWNAAWGESAKSSRGCTMHRTRNNEKIIAYLKFCVVGHEQNFNQCGSHVFPFYIPFPFFGEWHTACAGSRRAPPVSHLFRVLNTVPMFVKRNLLQKRNSCTNMYVYIYIDKYTSNDAKKGSYDNHSIWNTYHII